MYIGWHFRVSSPHKSTKIVSLSPSPIPFFNSYCISGIVLDTVYLMIGTHLAYVPVQIL